MNLRQHLQTMGFSYGDSPAHNGPWKMTERYRAHHLRGSFNLAARRAAGFDERELAALQAG